jgi:hypothetical protein
VIRAALIGLAVAAAVLGATIGLRAERLLGASAPTIELVATVPGDAPLGACERAWRARLRAYDIKMRVVDATDETTILRIAVRGAVPRDADALAEALARPGTLGFHWVDSDAAVSRAWAARFDPAQGGARGGGALTAALLVAVAGGRRRRGAALARVLLELAVQRLAIEAEALGGAGLVAALVVEDALDVLALERRHGHVRATAAARKSPGLRSRTWPGRSSATITSPWHSAAPRSRTLCSSRTLPGQA